MKYLNLIFLVPSFFFDYQLEEEDGLTFKVEHRQVSNQGSSPEAADVGVLHSSIRGEDDGLLG